MYCIKFYSSSAENSTNKTDSSQDITSLNKHHAVRNIQCLPLPPSALESQSSSLGKKSYKTIIYIQFNDLDSINIILL